MKVHYTLYLHTTYTIQIAEVCKNNQRGHLQGWVEHNMM